MTRKEFMRQLEQLLKELPEHDRLDAIAYYEDYFDEAGPENEAVLLQKLGSPEKVAATIKRENQTRGNEQREYTENGYSYGQEAVNAHKPAKKQTEKKARGPLPVALVVILLIFTLPVWGGLLSGAFGILVGILAAIFGCMVALVALIVAGLIGGVAAMVVGLTKLVASPALGLLGIGVGTLLLAMGLLLLVLFLWLVIKVFPAVFRFIVELCRKGMHKLRGGNRNE